jgi:hypothetical protein
VVVDRAGYLREDDAARDGAHDTALRCIGGEMAKPVAGPDGIRHANTNARAAETHEPSAGWDASSVESLDCKLRGSSCKDPPSECRSPHMPCRLLSALRRRRSSRGRRASRDYAANRSLHGKLRATRLRDIPLFRDNAKITRSRESPVAAYERGLTAARVNRAASLRGIASDALDHPFEGVTGRGLRTGFDGLARHV